MNYPPSQTFNYGWDTLVGAVAFSPDGSYFLTTSGDGITHKWRGDTGDGPLADYHDSLHGNFEPLALSISKTGDYFFTVTRNTQAPLGESLLGKANRVKLWSARSGNPVSDNPDHRFAGTFSPDGRRFASATAMGNDFALQVLVACRRVTITTGHTSL